MVVALQVVVCLISLIWFLIIDTLLFDCWFIGTRLCFFFFFIWYRLLDILCSRGGFHRYYVAQLVSTNSGSGKISLIIVKGGYVDCVFTPVK